MDTRLPTPLNVRKLPVTRRERFETTIEVLQYLSEMEIAVPALIGEPDMYRFIYNINRIRRNTLPNDFKHLSKGRKYITLNLHDLESLLIIRVK